MLPKENLSLNTSNNHFSKCPEMEKFGLHYALCLLASYTVCKSESDCFSRVSHSVQTFVVVCLVPAINLFQLTRSGVFAGVLGCPGFMGFIEPQIRHGIRGTGSGQTLKGTPQRKVFWLTLPVSSCCFPLPLSRSNPRSLSLAFYGCHGHLKEIRLNSINF